MHSKSPTKIKEQKYSGNDLIQRLRYPYSGEGQHSLNPYKENKRFEEPEFKGSTPLMVAASFADGAGCPNFATGLVADKPERAFEAVEDKNRPDYDGMTVGSLAAYANAFEFFNQICITLETPTVLGREGLINFLNTGNPHGEDEGSTPLMYFARSKSSSNLIQQMKRILKQGADATIRLPDSRGELAKFSALDFALKAENYSIARIVLAYLKHKKNFDLNSFLFESFKLVIQQNNLRSFKFLMVEVEKNDLLKNQVVNFLKQENRDNRLNKFISYCEKETSQMQVDSDSKKRKVNFKNEPSKKTKLEACRFHAGSSQKSNPANPLELLATTSARFVGKK